MPEAHDYGQADSKTLVPGSLRVFRHFLVDMRNGLLLPMNYSHKQAAAGYPTTVRNRSYDPMEPVHTARCTRSASPHSARYVMEHPTPSAHCTCGFYASYDPATDFYPSYRWGKEWARLADQPHRKPMAVVRAVVEMSGTVVMGRLGVRAERMKIVALAIDWEKRVKPDSSLIYYWNADDDDAPLYEGVWDEHTQSWKMQLRTEPDADADDDTEITGDVLAIAARYGAEFHDSVAEMYERYPKEDVEALGVDTTTPVPKPAYAGAAVAYSAYAQQMGVYASQLAKQMQIATDVIKQTQASFRGLSANLIISDEAYAAVEKLPKSKIRYGNPVFVEALEAKRNRPAPPGTGIDRRKRKL